MVSKKKNSQREWMINSFNMSSVQNFNISVELYISFNFSQYPTSDDASEFFFLTLVNRITYFEFEL